MYLLAGVGGVANEALARGVEQVEESDIDLNIERSTEVNVDESKVELEVETDLGVDIESNALSVDGHPVVAVLLLAVVATITALVVLDLARVAAGFEGLRDFDGSGFDGQAGRAGHDGSGQSDEGSSELHVGG